MTTGPALSAAIRRRYPPYPQYKDSGVEWLGQIPTHWGLRRLGWLTQCLDGRRVPLNAEERGRMQGEYPYWGANSVVDYVDRWLFDEELVLLGEDGAPFFDRTKPVAFRVSGKIWVNNHAHVLRARSGMDASFLAQALNSVDYRAFIDGATRDKLTQGDMNSISIQCPPLPEQRAIAAFLDRETGKIDALVARMERLIELLLEKRTALISHAVTKGLDPNAPMKDSGVEWLGKVPAHWEVRTLKQACTESALYGANEPASSYGVEGVRFIRTTDIDDHGRLLGEGAVYVDRRLVEGYLLQDGDLLVSRSGTLGRAFVYRESAHGACAYAGYLVRFKPGASLWAPFAFYYTKSSSFHDWLGISAITSTIGNVSGQKYADMHIVLPSIAEQRAIAAFLDRETARIDALVAKAREAIERLREYRAALISAAVTGKIDVRGEVERQH